MRFRARAESTSVTQGCKKRYTTDSGRTKQRRSDNRVTCAVNTVKRRGIATKCSASTGELINSSRVGTTAGTAPVAFVYIASLLRRNNENLAIARNHPLYTPCYQIETVEDENPSYFRINFDSIEQYPATQPETKGLPIKDGYGTTKDLCIKFAAVFGSGKIVKDLPRPEFHHGNFWGKLDRARENGRVYSVTSVLRRRFRLRRSTLNRVAGQSSITIVYEKRMLRGLYFIQVRNNNVPNLIQTQAYSKWAQTMMQNQMAWTQEVHGEYSAEDKLVYQPFDR
ncbi:hypothetical protein ALC57_09813 [Trachymyrmex cornetzi]|uniref:Uncharacterized protein n=1 Tax=Trachymyrmex cornetzi TaxID=471704 RepID=A0A195DYM0_9HYME|nr:hypothetical protein ALC57_09813 [Trachymyrmex cornetzi]